MLFATLLLREGVFPHIALRTSIALENLAKTSPRPKHISPELSGPVCLLQGKRLRKSRKELDLGRMVSRPCKLAARPRSKLSTRSEASPLKRKSFLSGRNPSSKRAARARFFFAQAGLDGSAPSYARPEQDADTRAPLFRTGKLRDRAPGLA